MSNGVPPPVLLLTGTNAAPWTMDSVRQSFEQSGFTCHPVTYRFHAMPPGLERDAKLIGVGIKDYLNDAREVLRDIGQPPVVVSHSLGGVIAQLLAAEGAVRAGVLLNSCIVNGVLPSTDGERQLGKMFISAGAFWDQALGQDLELLANYGLNSLSAELQRDIHARLGTESGRVLFEFVFWMYDVEQTTLVKPEQVTFPLLFVSGTEDKAVSTRTARLMAELYETADFLPIEGACHYIQFQDDWPKTAAEVLNWLTERL